MRIILDISRILVGTLFIFSGIIKANDPLGFSYKLEEYWVEFGMAWDWLLAIGTPLASFICIFEIVLGVAFLVAYRMKLASALALLMMVFFTILTFASAVFGLVKSCGCFGDAIPLTPWQSFIKDVILMVFIVVIYAYRKEIKQYDAQYKNTAFVIFPVALLAWTSMQVEWNFPLYFGLVVLGIGYVVSFVTSKNASMITTALAAVGSVWLCVQSIDHLPMKDFRPYAVGKNIHDQMHLPDDAKPDVYENIMYYKNLTTGDVEEFDDQNYPWDDDNYEFHDRETRLIEKGDEPKITDFSITASDGYNLTEDVLEDPDPVLVLISYDITAVNQDKNSDIKTLIDACNANGLSIIGLCASDESLVQDYVSKAQFEITFYATDQITLKTIVRSNPGFMLMKKGEVLGKWHVNDTPDFGEVKKLI